MEDKKLGFFFCKANQGKISAETFVGKVIFYLWNDVFKDFGFDNNIFNDEDGETLSFNKFYTTNIEGKVIVRKEKVEKFLKNLEVEVIEVKGEEEIIDEAYDDDVSATNSKARRKLVVEFPDGTIFEKDKQFDTYLSALGKIGLERVEPIAAKKKYQRFDCAFVDKEQRDPILKNTAGLVYVQVGDYYVIKNIVIESVIAFLNQLSEELDLNLKVYTLLSLNKTDNINV